MSVSSASVASLWDYITVEDYGMVGKITIKQNGSVLNISTYTTKQFIFLKPSGTTLTVTADFDTDGSNGILKYTFLAGNINEAGQWKVQARIAKTGIEISSEAIPFVVKERLD